MANIDYQSCKFVRKPATVHWEKYPWIVDPQNYKMYSGHNFEVVTVLYGKAKNKF